jgi:hypothetical protein
MYMKRGSSYRVTFLHSPRKASQDESAYHPTWSVRIMPVAGTRPSLSEPAKRNKSRRDAFGGKVGICVGAAEVALVSRVGRGNPKATETYLGAAGRC